MTFFFFFFFYLVLCVVALPSSRCLLRQACRRCLITKCTSHRSEGPSLTAAFQRNGGPQRWQVNTCAAELPAGSFCECGVLTMAATLGCANDGDESNVNDDGCEWSATDENDDDDDGDDDDDDGDETPARLAAPQAGGSRVGPRYSTISIEVPDGVYSFFTDISEHRLIPRDPLCAAVPGRIAAVRSADGCAVDAVDSIRVAVGCRARIQDGGAA